MGLEDFKKIENVEGIENVNVEDLIGAVDNIDCIDYKSIEYYLSHLDELLECLAKNYNNYISFKLRYEIKKDQYQVTTNWNEENALRESNGLPKITAQNQRDSVINLKLKNHHEKMKYFEMKYRFYSKLFDFISKNYEMLCDFYKNDEN